MKEKITLYYDEECPFCKKYSSFLLLRKEYILDLKSARENIKTIIDVYNLDINDGFIVMYKGKSFQGLKALQFLDSIVNKKTILGKLHFLFRYDNIFSQILYKLFLFLRKIALLIMRKNINI